MQKVEVNCVGEEIELFRLPGTEAFPVVVDALPISRSFNLLREREKIGGEVERLRRYDRGSLMIIVVFPHDVVGQPGENYLWARETNQAYDFLQCLPVSPNLQGMKYVATGSVRSAKKPGIRNAVRGQGMSCLHLANVGQSL